jgi:hypothetical protein
MRVTTRSFAFCLVTIAALGSLLPPAAMAQTTNDSRAAAIDERVHAEMQKRASRRSGRAFERPTAALGCDQACGVSGRAKRFLPVDRSAQKSRRQGFALSPADG